MELRGWRLWGSAGIAAVLAFSVTGRAAEKHAGNAGAAPSARIAVGPLGYIAPSEAYLYLRQASASLDFIDDGHLLFTFHKNVLLPRIPGDSPDDDDQIIHAVVMDIKSSKVLQQADWRMHDKARYLWALRDGQFLVRERNSLFLTDSTLVLRPYLTFDTDLEAIQVSPGRTLMLIEVEKRVAPKEEGEGNAPSLISGSKAARQTRTEMVLLRPGERQVLANAEMLNPAYLPLLENGFLDVDEGKKAKQWVIVKKLLDKTKKEIGEVKSSCAPQLVTLSDQVALSQNCPVNGGGGNAVSAVSMSGGILWQDLWESKYIRPEFSYSEDGSRFAFESLETNRQIGPMESFGEADVVAQPVGVFDTETGKLVLVEDASPILSVGQNFALSADGRRFAILRNGAIEVYDLPPVAATGAVVGSPKMAGGVKQQAVHH